MIVFHYKVDTFRIAIYMADILRNYHSTMKLVVVSGYEIVKDKLKDDEVKILIKPFTKYQLMELLGL